MTSAFKLGIDWGEKSLGVALSRIEGDINTLIYAATLVAEEKWLKEKVARRSEERRLKRTRKSRKKRLKTIKSVLASLALDSHIKSFILSFCKRRGFDYAEKNEEDKSDAEERYSVHRTDFLKALSKELTNRIPSRSQEILDSLRPILNRQIRPKRFLNRNTSKCQWHNCTRNTPKRANSTEETLVLELYPKLHPFLTGSNTDTGSSAEAESKIEAFIKNASHIATLHRNRQNDRQKEGLKKEFSTRCKKFKKDILGLVKNKERFNKMWNNGRIRENINNIVLDSPAGRQTFCREHVKEYKKFFLAGKPIPKRRAVQESDLTKRQEILFSKLFAFIKGRLLSLTERHGISEITVERNAFDTVPRKYRPHMEKGRKKGLSEEKLSELYWYGPKYGFENEREMFFREFNGRCAYCYGPLQKKTYHIEHIFHKAFPMDGYLNKVPSCPGCNRKKGARTAIEARMPIHPQACAAYGNYLKSKNPRHFLMIAKNGVLNLLTGVNGGFRGEQPETKFRPFTEQGLVQMLGRGLVSQARTQSSSRMLARYLATKLENLTGHRPEVKSFNARYVAYIRTRFCSEFYKDIERRHGHALDAAILSCRWPGPNIPGRGNDGKERWDFNINWNTELKKVWPENIKGDGTLELPDNIESIDGFEERLAKGGFFINLSSTNWNPRETSVADQTIYCTRHNKPCVREPARDWLDKLKEKDPVKHIETIAHPNLKTLLLDTFRKTDSKEEIEKVFKGWLRNTVKAGLKGPCPAHPSSRTKWKELETFVGGAEDIPPTVGLRLVKEKGIEESPDIRRLRNGRLVHAQRAQPSYKYFLVAYKRGKPDKKKPLVLGVKQSWRVERKYGPKKETDNIVNRKTCLRNGRPYRDREKERDFLVRWKNEMNELFEECGYRPYHRVSQGNVILYEDGRHMLVKNFKEGKNISQKTFCNIRRVYSSPYNFLLKNTA